MVLLGVITVTVGCGVERTHVQAYLPLGKCIRCFRIGRTLQGFGFYSIACFLTGRALYGQDVSKGLSFLRVNFAFKGSNVGRLRTVLRILGLCLVRGLCEVNFRLQLVGGLDINGNRLRIIGFRLGRALDFLNDIVLYVFQRVAFIAHFNGNDQCFKAFRHLRIFRFNRRFLMTIF